LAAYLRPLPQFARFDEAGLWHPGGEVSAGPSLTEDRVQTEFRQRRRGSFGSVADPLSGAGTLSPLAATFRNYPIIRACVAHGASAALVRLPPRRQS
jgi:hypothetical protein